MKFEEYLYYQRRDAAKEAAKENTIQNILELLEDCGEVPEALKERLNGTEDMGLLKRYLKLAARSGSIAEFQAALSE